MSEAGRDKWIEVVTEMVVQTEAGAMEWTKIDRTKPTSGMSAYYADHNDQRWVIRGEERDDAHGPPHHPRYRRFDRVTLDVVDENGESRFPVPDVPNLELLLETVQKRDSDALDPDAVLGRFWHR